jgi:hypothetical protein
MSSIEHAVALIRRVHAEIGTAEFSRLSGVPYTTLKDCEARNFVGPSIETLQKLAGAAERFAEVAGDQGAAA